MHPEPGVPLLGVERGQGEATAGDLPVDEPLELGVALVGRAAGVLLPTDGEEEPLGILHHWVLHPLSFGRLAGSPLQPSSGKSRPERGGQSKPLSRQ